MKSLHISCEVAVPFAFMFLVANPSGYGRRTAKTAQRLPMHTPRKAETAAPLGLILKFLLKTVWSAGFKKHIMKPTFSAIAVIRKPMRQLKPKTNKLYRAKSVQPTRDAPDV